MHEESDDQSHTCISGHGYLKVIVRLRNHIPLLAYHIQYLHTVNIFYKTLL
ncbi:unnamed protein product [Acanthoscelides obtectus]|uniref:Uncharacterized protein n=1 Tax=Acanthoscelides obtectus TaxID=200917 RepID=A0A9P0JWR8_ACAOB|nr:unnamed protein product [Acanthoscelides obtectus]CAK1625213.1 hypothetical protein AOBTE_LOCUS3036 [Acanthoscelides obtectus]